MLSYVYARGRCQIVLHVWLAVVLLRRLRWKNLSSSLSHANYLIFKASVQVDEITKYEIQLRMQRQFKILNKMQNLTTEILEISIDSIFLLVYDFAHVIHVGLFVAQQKNQLSGVQIVLIDTIARVYGQVAYFRLHHSHPFTDLVHRLLSIS